MNQWPSPDMDVTVRAERLEQLEAAERLLREVADDLEGGALTVTEATANDVITWALNRGPL
jgi:hypothetical protein